MKHFSAGVKIPPRIRARGLDGKSQGNNDAGPPSRIPLAKDQGLYLSVQGRPAS